MNIGIDASNIRGGGGMNHLVETLRVAQPQKHNFDQIVVWGGNSTLNEIEERPWLRKVHDPLLDRSLPLRLYWQRFVLDNLAQQEGCNVLFVPGGSYFGSFRPFVAVSQNLLPFEWNEARRYGFSWMLLKFLLLRRSQTKTLRRADGVIFLTNYARDATMRILKQIQSPDVVIPYGVSKIFDYPPKVQQPIEAYSLQKPFRLLYVSIVTVYKHQWYVAEAVTALRKKGLPVHLELVGPAYPPAMQRLEKILNRLDPTEEFIHYRGPIPYNELHREYQQADAFVFASTCETFGQIVTEAMTAGLPIACSNTGTMREILGEDALYFDPECPTEIADVIQKMISDPSMRTRMASGTYERVNVFTWERCARETFDFVTHMMRKFTG